MSLDEFSRKVVRVGYRNYSKDGINYLFLRNPKLVEWGGIQFICGEWMDSGSKKAGDNAAIRWDHVVDLGTG